MWCCGSGTHERSRLQLALGPERTLVLLEEGPKLEGTDSQTPRALVSLYQVPAANGSKRKTCIRIEAADFPFCHGRRWHIHRDL